MKPRVWWIDAAIVLIAFALRIAWIDIKPPHFDEGVNGWFVDEMTRTGYYRYQPGNFHGPLHFYALFVSLTLFGRKVWALRLPIVIVSTLCVAAMLAFRRYLPARACRIAALAMAISPGCVFYGRYSIHESWLLLFQLVTVWGLAGLWRGGGRRELWASMLGVTGMILTKETYAMHCVVLALAFPALLVWERISPSAAFARRAGHWTMRDLDRALVTSMVLIFLFYTGMLFDWSMLGGLVLTFEKWIRTGTDGAGGHAKDWYYFVELFARYEWPALLGLGAVAGLAIKGTSRFTRYVAICGCGALAAYSLIAYKTPWCVIVLIWPFHFVFGMAVHRLLDEIDRWTVGVVAALVLACSLAASWSLNFQNYTDEDEPYVYVQTLPDIRKLLDPLRALTERDPRNFFVTANVRTVDQHPLIWLLGDYPNIDIGGPKDDPASWDGAFLLIDDSETERAEESLTQNYFKETIRPRGSAGEVNVLYLNTAQFGFYFPGREPDFVPTLK